MGEPVQMKPAYIETLREMQGYAYYPFRQATCRKLLALGPNDCNTGVPQ